MKMDEPLSRVTALPSFPQSDSRIWPTRSCWASTLASEANNRCVSSRWPISSEKSRAGRPRSMPTWASIPRAKLVLPMAGRAPTMVRLDACSPARIRSRSRYPVARPVRLSPRRESSSMRSRLGPTRSRNEAMVSVVRRWATSKIICSASSTAPVTSSGTE